MDGAAVAAGFAPLQAVFGVAVVEQGLAALDHRGDPQLVDAAWVALGFAGPGPKVTAGPERVESFAGHPRPQVAHPVAVVGADHPDRLLLRLAPGVDTVGVDLGDRAAHRVGVLCWGAAGGLGQHDLLDPAGLVAGQWRGELGEPGRLV